MKKYITLFFIFISVSNAWSCGEYLIQAQVIMKDGISSLIINPQSLSEITLKPEINESLKLSPYIGRMIETKIKIFKKINFTKGEVSSIGKIKVIFPDPLANSKGTSMEILKKLDCKK